MRRVDQAMRRAGTSPTQDDLQLPAGTEAYPIEMPDRHPIELPEHLPIDVPERRQAALDLADQLRPQEDAASQVPTPEPFVDIRPEPPGDESEKRSGFRLFERFHPNVTEKMVIDRRMPSACREQYRRRGPRVAD